MPYNANFNKQSYTYSQGDCPIATVQVTGFTPNKIINTISYDNDIHENSEYYLKSTKLSPTYIDDESISGHMVGSISGYMITYYQVNDNYYINYLVTDKVNLNTKPLYYAYELKYDVYGITNDSTVQIYKNNETQVSKNNYKVEYSTSTLGNNYYGTKDSDMDRYGSGIIWTSFNSSYDIHRVRVLLPIDVQNKDEFYTIRYNKHLYGINYSNHIELIEFNNLYTQDTDFISSGQYIIPTANSKIPVGAINNLYIIKDPAKRITSTGIHSIQGETYQKEVNTNWNMKMSDGEFITNASYIGADNDYFCIDYIPPDISGLMTYYDQYQYMKNIKPKIIGKNILKIEEKPVYIEENDYTYPNYTINIYAKTTDDMEIPSGYISIDIDGVNTTNIGISSIDRNKGYLLLNNAISSTDDIRLHLYTDISDEFYIRNLELNPRISGDYGFNPGCVTSFSNIGIAIRKSPADGVPNETEALRAYKFPYFFDFDEINSEGSGIFYRGSYVPNLSGLNVNGYLTNNPYTSYSNVSGEFTPLYHLSVNKLTPDILTINDARVIGGGTHVGDMYKLDNKQLNSYSEIGYYDGEPLPHSSLLVIHIPSGTYTSLVDKWEGSDLFNVDMYTDVTVEELKAFGAVNSGEYAEYYNKLVNGVSPTTGDQVKDPFVSMRNNWAKKQASHYIDQLIKKYISAGTQYILLDEKFNEIGLDLNV